MLINFYVKNFRSIRDEIQLNLVADGRYKNHNDHLEPIIALDKSALKNGRTLRCECGWKIKRCASNRFRKRYGLRVWARAIGCKTINSLDAQILRRNFNFSFKLVSISLTLDLNCWESRLLANGS